MTHQAASSEMVRSVPVATVATCESSVSSREGWRRVESTKKYSGDGAQFIATARAIDQSTPADGERDKTRVERGRGRQAEERNVVEKVASANVIPDGTLIDTDEGEKERAPEQGRCAERRETARVKGYEKNNGLWHPCRSDRAADRGSNRNDNDEEKDEEEEE